MQINNSGYQSSPKSSTDIESIIVVCAADNNYSMPLAVTMRSAIENLKDNCKIIFYIIDGGITNLNKQKILKSLILGRCEVKFVSMPDYLLRDIQEAHKTLESANRRIKSHITIASFYRLIISELLPNNVEKVIYLDCDLVVKGDLGQLWQSDIENSYMLATQDTWIQYVSNPYGLLNYQELGIPSDLKYFNAGVLLINLKKWRTDNISAKAITYLKQNREYIRWHDQDVLNALLYGQWGELGPRWNLSATIFGGYWKECPFTEEVYNAVIMEPNIIHFTTEKKPWTSRHTLCKEYFYYYLDMTAWSGWRLTVWRRLWLRLKPLILKYAPKI